MRVRWKIVLVVLPLLLVTIGLTGVSAVFSARTGITRITQEFLAFKAGRLQNSAEGQWRLLVENGFTQRPDMIAATQSGIESFAASLIGTDSEIVIAIDADGEVVGSTRELAVAPAERERLRRIFADRDTTLQDIVLGGEARVAKGFYFAPFDWFYLLTESRATFYRDIEQITVRTALILSISLVFALTLLLLFAGQITRPISRIVDGMRNIIQSGDLSERVQIDYRDETGELAHTFNLMLGELDRAYGQVKSHAFQAVLAQKKETKTRTLFQKYVPQEVINRVFQNPEGMLVGENRAIAILFSDIRSFTSISEAMRPDDLVQSLNRYFSVMVDIIMSRNGVIDKYIGDAIMAFFGAPVHHSDDAFQAVMAGVQMSESIKTFNARQIAAGKPEFRTGIGINYGEVTVGNIGTDKKMDYTVIGDAVNLASRLEGLTKPYRQDLIISETLFAHIHDRLPWRLLDSVTVKGKSVGVKIYAVKRRLNKVEERGWRAHNRAMRHYYARDFAAAREALLSVERILPGDATAAKLRARCERLIEHPPPSDWDFAEVMTST